METKQKRTRVVVSVLALAGLAVCSLIGYAGSLEPSGPPGPTMKTLDDVEPRVAIRNKFNTLTPIVISQQGSYYLAEDILAFPGAHGIEITASNVTLDLNGFTVYGNTEVGSLDGIHVTASKENITIMNGTVRDFFNDGVDSQTDYSRMSNLVVLNNSQDGIKVTGTSAIIRDCIARDNGDVGISAGASATLIGNAVGDNGGIGIQAFSAVVAHCTARGNTGDGIWVNNGSVVRGCCAVSNTGDGIEAEQSLVQGNSAVNNGGSDIVPDATSVIIENNT
jgi:hypothetical protein